MNRYFCLVLNLLYAWLHLLQTHWSRPTSLISPHLTSILAIKSKNWAPPTNNASCLGHYSFIIYILIYYLPWSRKVQFTWWVSIMFFTEVSKDSTNIIFPCQSREWHFSSNCPGTKVHRVKTEAPIHWVPDFLDCISKCWVLHRI